MLKKLRNTTKAKPYKCKYLQACRSDRYVDKTNTMCRPKKEPPYTITAISIG